MPTDIYIITKVPNRGVTNSRNKLQQIIIELAFCIGSSFTNRDEIYSCRDLLKYRKKNKLSTDTEYSKMAVQVTCSFVVIKAQHGVSARKSVQTQHTCKEKKGRLTGIVSVTL